MNDKQQLASMGEHMAKKAGQAQPLCMAKRIEELESQVRGLAGLLREAQRYVRYRLEYTECDARIVMGLIFDIDEALAGNLRQTAAPKPQIVGVQGPEAGFSVSFANGMLDDPHISFNQLAFDGDGVNGQHICALQAAANFLMDQADWYVKGAAAINQPYPIKGKTPPAAPEDWQLVPAVVIDEWAAKYEPSTHYSNEAATEISSMLASAPSRNPSHDLHRGPCQRRGAIPATPGGLCSHPVAGAAGGHTAQRSEAQADRTPHHYRAGARGCGSSVAVSVCGIYHNNKQEKQEPMTWQS